MAKQTPEFSLDITPADFKQLVIDGLAANSNYQANIPDGSGQLIPNPQTKDDLFNTWLGNVLNDLAVSGQAKAAAEAAAKMAKDNVEAAWDKAKPAVKK